MEKQEIDRHAKKFEVALLTYRAEQTVANYLLLLSATVRLRREIAKAYAG